MKKKLQDGGPLFKGSPKSDKKISRRVSKKNIKVLEQFESTPNPAREAAMTKQKTEMAKRISKMQAGGVVKSQPKRVGPVDPNGAYTKVQERTLAGAKVKKVPLTKDKELGATKMKKGGKVSKKK
jgi:hypothetical protein